MNVLLAMLMLPGLVIGLTLHEFAHAWASSRLGDNFPRRQGRVSLNPFRHLSPLGTLAIFVLPFGWARPVVVNLYNFKHPKRDYLLSSLAGPGANLVVVAACMGLMLITRRSYAFGAAQPFVSLAHYLLMFVALINVVLAMVNLLPIPPLDGSKIWPCVIPGLKPAAGRKTTWLFLILLAVLMYTHSLGPLVAAGTDALLRIMPVADSQEYFERQQAGMAAMGQRDFAEAERLFGEAIMINRRGHECLYGRALCRAWRKDWEAALEDIDAAIALRPAEPLYYECRATVYRSLEQADKAQEDTETANALRRVSRSASAPAASSPGR